MGLQGAFLSENSEWWASSRRCFLWSQVGYSVNKLIWRPSLPFRTVGLKDGRACETATVTQVFPPEVGFAEQMEAES